MSIISTKVKKINANYERILEIIKDGGVIECIPSRKFRVTSPQAKSGNNIRQFKLSYGPDLYS